MQRFLKLEESFLSGIPESNLVRYHARSENQVALACRMVMRINGDHLAAAACYALQRR